MSSPKLRFKGFSVEWRSKRLENVSDFLDYKRKPIKSGDRQNIKGIYPYYGASGIIDYVNDYIFDEDLILLGEDGENIISRNLPLAFKIKGKCWVNNHAHVIKPKSIVDIDFLTQSLENISYLKYNTGTAQPKLNQEVCKNIPIKLPSFPEQEKIANFFTTIDQKLNLLKEKKEKLELYKKGVMQQIFSQKLRFKDEKGNEFPNWEGKKLGAVLTIGSGRDYKHLKKGNVPVYGTGGLMLYVDNFLYDGESVGIGRKGTINKPVFLENKFWTVDTLFYTHSFKNCIPKFIYFTFLTINWLQYNEAGGVPSLSKSTIDQIQIQIPSLPEQEKIAQFLSTLDAKINLVETQTKKTELWKKGLLQQMFV